MADLSAGASEGNFAVAAGVFITRPEHRAATFTVSSWRRVQSYIDDFSVARSKRRIFRELQQFKNAGGRLARAVLYGVRVNGVTSSTALSRK
jgi:hypothetical protein